MGVRVPLPAPARAVAPSRCARAGLRSAHGRIVRALEGYIGTLPPRFVVDHVIRRLMEDPAYQAQFMRYLARAVPPDDWRPPGLILGALGRGVIRDLQRRLTRRAPAT